MWYGVEALPRLRAMSREDRLALMQQVDEHNATHPLHLTPKEQFPVPLWKEKPLSGGHCIALLVFGLWVQCGESEETASGLYDSWKDVINPAMALTR